MCELSEVSELRPEGCVDTGESDSATVRIKCELRCELRAKGVVMSPSEDLIRTLFAASCELSPALQTRVNAC